MRIIASPIAAIIALFAGNTFLTFQRLQDETGLSRADIISLKPILERLLKAEITSRVDLAEPGFFLEY